MMKINEIWDLVNCGGKGTNRNSNWIVGIVVFSSITVLYDIETKGQIFLTNFGWQALPLEHKNNGRQ